MADEKRFSKAVCEKLDNYVYRLIDPRNGQTFYVGRGTGNRVFDHAKGEAKKDQDDDLDEKTQRIREIRLAGLSVIHVIHRHGMNEETAREVEAALIDAYPEGNNLAPGDDSADRGVMHAHQIIERYEARELVFYHDVLIIKIPRTASEKSIYEAVRSAWRINRKRAEKMEYILAADRGLIVGVFKASQWRAASVEGRSEFVGKEAPDDIQKRYIRRRLPDDFKKKGAATPVWYVTQKKAEAEDGEVANS